MTDLVTSLAAKAAAAHAHIPADVTGLVDILITIQGDLSTLSTALDTLTTVVGISVVLETPDGTPNDVLAIFTLDHTPTTETLYVYVDGILYLEGVHYTRSGGTLTFEAGYIPQTGARIRASYRW